MTLTIAKKVFEVVGYSRREADVEADNEDEALDKFVEENGEFEDYDIRELEPSTYTVYFFKGDTPKTFDIVSFRYPAKNEVLRLVDLWCGGDGFDKTSIVVKRKQNVTA